MKITQKLDELNRLLLPSDVKCLNWGPGTPLDIEIQEDAVVLKRHVPGCAICGETEGLIIVVPTHGRQLCGACLMAACAVVLGQA